MQNRVAHEGRSDKQHADILDSRAFFCKQCSSSKMQAEMFLFLLKGRCRLITRLVVRGERKITIKQGQGDRAMLSPTTAIPSMVSIRNSEC